MGFCFNKKVLAGLAVVALGILVVAPNLFLGMLPLLLFAACPLSMLFMGKAMMGGQRGAVSERAASGGLDPALDRPEQLALLRMQLLRVGEEQAMLAQRLAALQAAEAPALRSGTALPQAGEMGQPVAARS